MTDFLEERTSPRPSERLSKNILLPQAGPAKAFPQLSPFFPFPNPHENLALPPLFPPDCHSLTKLVKGKIN